MHERTSRTGTEATLSTRDRMALIQSSWSRTERRRRRELAAFLQKRLAWQLALDTVKCQGAVEAAHA